jgi:DTW domain-containing protein YfiP
MERGAAERCGVSGFAENKACTLCSDGGRCSFAANALRNKRAFEAWRASPGVRCATCWMTKTTGCFCDAFPAGAAAPHSLLLYCASKELAAHASSNTGKLVLMWGGTLIVEGVEEDEAIFDVWLRDAVNPVVLFPSAEAMPASPALVSDGPLSVVVIDASWRGARRMNDRIDASVPRACLADVDGACALRTRKRIGKDRARVQTAPALAQFLREVGADTSRLDEGLNVSFAAYSKQNPNSKKKFAPLADTGRGGLTRREARRAARAAQRGGAAPSGGAAEVSRRGR